MHDKKFEKVLVVDDEVDIRDILASYLSDLGFLVDVATNGCEALDKIKKNQYSFVFTDLKMPAMDGFELISEIINLNYPDTKIVVISASSFCDYPIEKEAILKKIVHGYIEKPFSKNDIYKVIKKIKNISAEPMLGNDIEEVIKNHIKQRKVITVIDRNGLELTNIVPVHYENGYLECGRPDSNTLFTFNSINEIVIIDELSQTKRLFGRKDLSKESIIIKTDVNEFTDCKVLDYSYTGLGVMVGSDFSYKSQYGYIILRRRDFPCKFVYYNRDIHRVGVYIDIEVGKEIEAMLTMKIS